MHRYQSLLQRPQLWPATAKRRVTWLELFFDLIFVAAIAQVGVALAADYSPNGLLHYGFAFVLIWSAWNGHTFFTTRFDSDDLLQRLLTFAQIFAVAAMAANARDVLSSRSSAGFAAAYAAMRMILALEYLRAMHIEKARRLVLHYGSSVGLAALIWLAAAFVPLPLRFWLWGVALLLDLLTPVIFHHTERLPPHAAHLPERFGLLTLILLGESVTAVMRGMESQESWTPAAAFSAIGGMGISFLFWWWYFERSSAVEERPIRNARDARLYYIWNAAHLPLYLGIAVTGIGVQHVISVVGRGNIAITPAFILLTAAAVVMAAIATISLAGCESRVRSSRMTAQLAVALLLPVVALAAPALAPAMLVAIILVATVAQIAISGTQSNVEAVAAIVA